MPTYVGRYTNGEYTAVWDELQRLAHDVREQPVYDDALAVARATMLRVKANVETVYERLKTLNFRFSEPELAYRPPPTDIPQRIAEIEKRGGIMSISLRAWYELVGGVNFVGDHPHLAIYEPDSIDPTQANRELEAKLFRLRNNLSSRFDTFIRKNYDKISSESIPFDEIKRIFKEKHSKEYEEVEQLGKVITQEQPPQIISDPLVVDLPPEVNANAEIWEEFLTGGDESRLLSCAISPDIFHKSNVSGGAPYVVMLGNPAMDGLLENEKHNITFVNYLRLSFRWGGFAAFEKLEVPPEMSTLIDGLLPF